MIEGGVDDDDDAINSTPDTSNDCATLLWPSEELHEQLSLPVGIVDWARGPHSRSNWLPLGWPRSRLCAGGWPFQVPGGYGFSGGETDEMAIAKVRSMVEAGITTFVNLTEEGDIPYSGSYEKWMSIVQDIEMSIFGAQAKTKLRFDILCEMPDGSIVSDAELATLLERTLSDLNEPTRKLYVHCYGGHGRTGVVACSLLCLLYPAEVLRQVSEQLKEEWARKNINRYFGKPKVSSEFWDIAEGAVAVFNRFHAERENEEGGGFCRFPHSPQQILQVVRVAERAGPFARFPLP